MTAAILNIINFLLEAGTFIYLYRKFPTRKERLRQLIYFTVDSNILCALASLIAGVCGLCGTVPYAVSVLKFTAASAVSVTMLVVIFFLGPVFGGHLQFYRQDGFTLHLLCPLIAIAGCVAFDAVPRAGLPLVLTGALPVVIYGAIYLRQVVFIGEDNGGWHDIYGFNIKGRWRISLVAMFIAALIISAALYAAGGIFA